MLAESPDAIVEWMKLGAVGIMGALVWKGMDFMKWFLQSRNSKTVVGGKALSAGELPSSHWEARFERLYTENGAISQILNQQTQILNRIADSNEAVHLDIVKILERTSR